MRRVFKDILILGLVFFMFFSSLTSAVTFASVVQDYREASEVSVDDTNSRRIYISEEHLRFYEENSDADTEFEVGIAETNTEIQDTEEWTYEDFLFEDVAIPGTEDEERYPDVVYSIIGFS